MLRLYVKTGCPFCKRVLDYAKPFIKDNNALIVDLSDISKEHSKKTEIPGSPDWTMLITSDQPERKLNN